MISISVNQRYLAVAFAGLKKDQLKGSSLKNVATAVNSTGIVLYGRDQHVVCSIHEKLIDLPDKSLPDNCTISIALTEGASLFAAERSTGRIYEIDLTTSSLMRTVSIDGGHPMSIGKENHFVQMGQTRQIPYVLWKL